MNSYLAVRYLVEVRMDDRPQYAIEATETSLAVFEALVTADGPLGVTALADEVGIAKSAAHNHLSTLQAGEYVVKRDGKYEPSLRSLAVGTRTRDRLPVFQDARAQIDNLAEATGETTALFVIEGNQAVPAYITEPPGGWSPPYREGERMPLHVNAPGKAILASLPDDRVEAILSKTTLSAPTQETITDVDVLREELAQIRDDRLTFSREEQFGGVVGVASPITRISGTRPAAIGVVGSAERLHGRYLEEDITGQVVSTANAIQVELSSE